MFRNHIHARISHSLPFHSNFGHVAFRRSNIQIGPMFGSHLFLLSIGVCLFAYKSYFRTNVSQDEIYGWRNY